LAQHGDLLDQHVEYFLSCHPEVRESRRIKKIMAGCYIINDRQVTLDWEHNDPQGGGGFLVVIDGHLRQAFESYVSGDNASGVYDSEGLKQSKLHMTPKDSRVTFPDEGVNYSRLEAMKVAKEQAHFREKAAHCVNSGHDTPSKCPENFDQVMGSRLGTSRKNYEEAKKRWGKKFQQEAIPKTYSENAAPSKHSADGSVVAPRNYRERFGSP